MPAAATAATMLSGCGSSNSGSTETKAAETTAATEAATEAETTTEAATEAAAENTDAYKDEDMSAYKVGGMSIGVSFGQNVHPFFKAMQKGIEDACADYGIEKISI